MNAEQSISVLQTLAHFFHAAQQHAINNAAVVSASQKVVEMVTQLSGGEPIVVASVAQAFFVNRALVKFPGGKNDSAESLRKLLERMKVQEVTLMPGFEMADVHHFVQAFQRHWQTPTPDAIKQETFERIKLRAVGSAHGNAFVGGAKIDARHNVLRHYARLTVLTQEALVRLKAGQPFRTPLIRKAIQQLADASAGYDDLLSGLTRFQNFRGELHFHLSAVAAMVLIMARRIGLSKAALIDIVLAALFHDLGRTALETTDLPEGDPASNRDSMAFRVPALSLLAATKDAMTPEALLQGTASFEQSLPIRNAGAWTPGRIGQLIAVPSFFSLLTMDHPQRKAMAPDQAMRSLMRQSGSRFDPAIIKLFARVVGMFPVGTTVRLTTGEIAVVMEVSKVPSNYNRPVVKIIRDANGPTDAVVDLLNDPNGRTIAESVEQTQHTLNATAFLLA